MRFRPHISAETVWVALLLSFVLPVTVSAASTYKILYNFGAPNDAYVPAGPPLLDNNGNLYGTSGGPGRYGNGLVFELTPQSDGKWSEAILYEFASADGLPQSPLTMDGIGNLFGTTVGGPIGSSEAYELSPGTPSWTFSSLYSSGAGPGLLIDNLGNLYGSIGVGVNKYGAIGELSPGSGTWTYTDLYNFCPNNNCNNGFDQLPAPPIWGTEGDLYGTTTTGGINTPPCYDQNGCGVIFRMTPNKNGTWSYHVLHRFGSYPTDGLSPYGGLAMDASGNFYGTTEGGGKYGYGTVFKLSFTNGHWQKTDLFDPSDLLNGLPGGNLVLDQAGNLYGVAGGGYTLCGGFSCGMVFKLTRQANDTFKYSVLHRFTAGPDGSGPWGVVVDANGNVFGTTNSGGTYNAGVAFEITP
jgi:uncharacterized repeat protein (TIGR03803 family)